MTKINRAMRHVNKVDMGFNNADLVKDYSFTDYSPMEYYCQRHGKKLKLVQGRVLFCRYGHHGHLHPRYNFVLDRIV
jgi:hypothetical protein